jgi:hypothetical protein
LRSNRRIESKGGLHAVCLGFISHLCRGCSEIRDLRSKLRSRRYYGFWAAVVSFELFEHTPVKAGMKRRHVRRVEAVIKHVRPTLLVGLVGEEGKLPPVFSTRLLGSYSNKSRAANFGGSASGGSPLLLVHTSPLDVAVGMLGIEPSVSATRKQRDTDSLHPDVIQRGRVRALPTAYPP